MKRIAIVGGGITGLMAALHLHEEYELTVIDAGEDPRSGRHEGGATYTGLDARHVSLTETAPWTAANRHELITTP
jgi:glycine/D-amino acid oxidase-like deaminating enzyme